MASQGNQHSKRVLTPRFRGSYPCLITPKPYTDEQGKKGEPRFTLDMILDPPDIAKFRAEDGSGNLVEIGVDRLAVQLAKERWPELASPEVLKAELTKGWPLIKGDILAAKREAKKKDGEAFKGKIIIRSKSYENVKPLLSYFDQTAGAGKGAWRVLSRSSDVDMKKAEDLFVGGNYFGAELTMKATEVSGTKYITFYINAVRFLADGEKFGGKGMMDRFDGVYGGEAAHDPTEGMTNDEIPF